MTFTTRATLAVYDVGHQLQFRVTRERGWLEQSLGAVVIVIFLYEAHKNHSPWFLALAVAGAVGLLVDAVRGKETELVVDEEELTVHDNLGILRDKVQLRMSRMIDLSYSPGGEDAESGLYAELGLQSTCILPCVSEQQALDVRNLILSRFPQLCRQMNGESMLSGKYNELITLDISRRR